MSKYSLITKQYQTVDYHLCAEMCENYDNNFYVVVYQNAFTLKVRDKLLVKI